MPVREHNPLYAYDCDLCEQPITQEEYSVGMQGLCNKCRIKLDRL